MDEILRAALESIAACSTDRTAVNTAQAALRQQIPASCDYGSAGVANHVAMAAQRLVGFACARGVVLTVEQKPLEPLAMGHFRTVVSVRASRVKP